MKFAAIVPLLHASACASESTALLRRSLQATWKPGVFSAGSVVEDTKYGHKVFLSNGLTGQAIAHVNEPVVAYDGTELSASYHVNADGGGCIPKTDGSGGYYYVSNSEIGEYPTDFDPDADRSDYAANLTGGAYSLEFNADHQLIGYQNILKNTAGNCAGGVTPWNTWVSCEERRQWGRCWQADPTNSIDAQPTNVTGSYGAADYGNWEAFAWDGESDRPRGYVTDDDYPAEGLPGWRGALVRFTPDKTARECLNKNNLAKRGCVLDSGTHDYLKLLPDSSGPSSGTFEWVTDLEEANPELYQGSEGVHVQDGVLTFVTVVEKEVFRLNLTDMTYIKKHVPFPQEPDNLRILGDVLYLCTDGDENPGDGVWAWDDQGAYRLFYETNHSYTAGVDFSPDRKIMYVSFYGEATWQFWREDGLRFDNATAGIKYEDCGLY